MPLAPCGPLQRVWAGGGRGLRAEVDDSTETMKYKIRGAQTRQVPYMLVVGEREQSSKTVAIRHRRKEDAGAASVDDLIARLKQEVASRALDPP